jgi:hypothetical protein
MNFFDCSSHISDGVDRSCHSVDQIAAGSARRLRSSRENTTPPCQVAVRINHGDEQFALAVVRTSLLVEVGVNAARRATSGAV